MIKKIKKVVDIETQNLRNKTLLFTRGKTRAEAYDYIMGGEFGDKLCTPHLYNEFLQTLPDKSNILEIGIGTGLCLKMNASTIKKKKLKITGIDIDAEYINMCKQNINDAGLNDLCVAKVQDLFDVKETYDYALFMESFPVIPIPVAGSMLQKAESVSNNIIFVHNICNDPNFLYRIIKSNLKNLVGVDFGRSTSYKEWVEFLDTYGFSIKKETKLHRIGTENYPQKHHKTWYGNIMTAIFPRDNYQYIFGVEKNA